LGNNDLGKVYFYTISINTTPKAHQGIQSYTRHMARSEHLTYNIGDAPKWPQQ